MGFDKYYQSVLDKFGATSHISNTNEWQHSTYTNDNFAVRIKSIELFDGIRLDFGSYSGDFKNFLPKLPRTEMLHFGYCARGRYNGLLEGNTPFCIGLADMWACSMSNTIYCDDVMTECECIGFDIDICRAKVEIGKFLKHCDIAYIHDYVVDNPLIYTAKKHISNLFSKLHCHNSDILRLATLELLMTLHTIATQMPRNWQQEDYCKEIYSTIQKHCDRDLSLDYFARIYDISIAKLTRDFAKTYNTSIYQSIKRCRMQKAFWLLKKGDKNITQVANEVGYINVSVFCKNFKQHFGKSPSKI